MPYIPGDVWEHIKTYLDQDSIVMEQHETIVQMTRAIEERNLLVASQNRWLQTLERENRILSRRLGFIRMRFMELQQIEQSRIQRILNYEDFTDEEYDDTEVIDLTDSDLEI